MNDTAKTRSPTDRFLAWVGFALAAMPCVYAIPHAACPLPGGGAEGPPERDTPRVCSGCQTNFAKLEAAVLRLAESEGLPKLTTRSPHA